MKETFQGLAAKEAAASRSESGGATSWFRDLSSAERHTFWASFGGLGLDAMDILLYSFVIPTLITLWGVTRGEAGTLATVSLLSSSVGGWVAGVLSDRFGRVRALQVTILWFSVFTCMSGLCNSYSQLLIVRVLQGFGFGGEYAIGAALMGEMIKPQHRGKAVGTVNSAWAVGWAVAAIAYALTFRFLPESAAWRILFFVGLLPGLFVVYLRRHVPEPEVFLKANVGAEKGSFLEIFRSGVFKTTLLTAILTTGLQGGYYSIMTWLPTYLKTVRGLSVLDTTAYLSVIIVASWFGYIVGAYLTDRLGRRLNFLVFSLCSVATVAIYMFVPINDHWMLFLGVPLGFFPSGTYSGIGAYLTELFPTRLRGSGMGFSYNFGRAFGALFPGLIGFLAKTTSLAAAIGFFTVGAYSLLLLAVLFLPETNGKTLD
ncbi:MFS transporter [Paraburkholderia fungorum]|uniref:MFS transporter n=1 Tax=Paraburkholderia fungorum TaxID=134537 RepID=UPI00402B5C1F